MDTLSFINVASDVVKWTPINLGLLIKRGLLSGVPTIHHLEIEKIRRQINENNLSF